MTLRCIAVVLITGILGLSISSRGMGTSPSTELSVPPGRYIHIAATACSVFVDGTDTSVVHYTRRGDVSVSSRRTDPDSLRLICRGGDGYVGIHIPRAERGSVLSIECEDVVLSMGDVEVDRVNVSGLDGSIQITTSATDSIVIVADRSVVELDVHARAVMSNLLDSRLVLRGKSGTLSVIGERGTLMAESAADTMIFDLMKVRSEIRFLDHSIRSCLVVSYLGEMHITAPETSLNGLLLHIDDGEFIMDENPPAVRTSGEDGRIVISTTHHRDHPNIRIISSGTVVEMESAP